MLQNSRRRLMSAGAAVALTLAAPVAGAGTAAAAPPPVDPALLATFATDGQTSFLVELTDRADLSGGSREPSPHRVYQQLTATADESQAGVREWLTDRGVAHTPYWIANVIQLTGDRELATALADHPDVARVVADRQWRVPEPTRAVSAVEWGGGFIRADRVWADYGVTGQGVVVATIDTGVQYDHPALVDQYRGTATGGHDYNWFDPAGACPSTAPCDNVGHGTHLTGVAVGGDGGTNQIGVAPGAQWIAAKGCASFSCSTSDLLAAGQWMLAPTDRNGNHPDPAMAPDIVLNGWGGAPGNDFFDEVVVAWDNAGIDSVWGVGGSGPACGTVGSPAEHPSAYAVTAHGQDRRVAGFASRGGGLGNVIKPDITAPGVSIRSAVPTDGYATYSGTTMAAAHAAGALALVRAAGGDGRPELDAAALDVPDLSCGGTPGDNNVYGEGLLDAYAAVGRVLSAAG